jgi:hypothetical protein
VIRLSPKALAACALLVLVIVLAGCEPGLVFNGSQGMTHDQMLQRATHIFVGTIERGRLESNDLFHLNPKETDVPHGRYWRILRRDVRIEIVIRGVEARKVVPIYEYFWIGGANGDWNATQEGERDLFLVRLEGGRYHIVRDWWRSIFEVASGYHSRLPMDDSHPLWERIALLSFWVRSDVKWGISRPQRDPGHALGQWRTVKLLRGLSHHPNAAVRSEACRELISTSWGGLDECWDKLSEDERIDVGSRAPVDVARFRRQMRIHTAPDSWESEPDLDRRRMFTTVSDQNQRAQFCQLYSHDYPGDTDNGCPANRPPPATIVTEQGDVPLVGPWPK